MFERGRDGLTSPVEFPASFDEADRRLLVLLTVLELGVLSVGVAVAWLVTWLLSL